MKHSDKRITLIIESYQTHKNMRKIILAALALVVLTGCTKTNGQMTNDQSQTPQVPIVYMTKDISPEGLVRIYEALGREATGRVAVKISTGEAGGHHFLQPALIEPLVSKVHGTIVECNTAYPGKRNTFEAHWQTIKEHGFLDIAPCDLMDEEGDMQVLLIGLQSLRCMLCLQKGILLPNQL